MLRALALLTPVMLMITPGVRSVSAQELPRSDGWVVISVEEYRALRLKAYPPEPPPELPPVDRAITRVDYDLRLSPQGDSIGGEARLTVDVLKDGWVAVPIPSGFLVRAARVEGRPVSIVDSGAPHVLLSKRGRTVIALDVVVPLRISGGSESVTVPAVAAAVSRVALVVPRRDIDLSVSGGVLADRPPDADRPWVAYALASQPLTMTWTKRVQDARPSQATRFRGSVTEAVGLGEETGLVTADVRIEVTQGLASAVNVLLPDGLIVNQVSGPLVADWEFRPGSLNVTFLEPFSAQTTMAIAAEMRVARDGAITVPLIRLAGAERETGGVAVEVLGAGEITDRQPRGLDPADPSDLGAALAARATPSMIAFRYRPQEGTAARSLAITVLRYTPQAVLVANVEEARYDALVGEEGKILVRARYAVRNNQRAFLGVVLPDGATLWSVAVASKPLRPGAGTTGGLLIPLEKVRSGENAPPFAVELTYVQRGEAWKEDGRATLALPTLDLPVSRTGITVHYSPRFRIKPEPGVFRADTDTGAFTDLLRREEAQVATASEGREGIGGGFGGRVGSVEEGVAGGVPGGVVGGVVGGLPDAARAPSGSPLAAPADKLIADFRKQSAGRSLAGVLPVRVPFPEFGDRLFLVSELTAEGQAASVQISYKREGRW